MRLSALLTGLALLWLIAASPAFGDDDIQAHPSCKYCGMDRAKFTHSRMLITYDDGSSVGVCSIHCAAIDLALNIDKSPTGIMVGDYPSKKPIDAEKAYWVLGGKVMGVMTKDAKWAFENKDGAERFIQENGGTLITFDEALTASYKDMSEDTKLIRERRKARKMQMQMEHQPEKKQMQ